MTSNKSIKDLLFDLYEDQLFQSLEEFLEGDPKAAELRNCDDVSGVEPYSLHIKFVRIGDLPGQSIEITIVVEAELLVSTYRYRYGGEDEIESQWFSFDCRVDVDQKFENFQVHNVEVYSGQKYNDNPLSDSLVPVFRKTDLDNVANDFLEKYYPEALVKPQALDVDVLTNRLGVTAKAAKLSKDCSIFGAMVFVDTTVRIVSENAYEEVPVSAGTLFYDPNVFFLRTLGSVRNTIVHECVHWVYHRKAMALERMFNPEVTDIRCQVEEVSEKQLQSSKRNPLDWMEWHANALAPRILMPRSSFQKYAEYTLRELLIQNQTQRVSDVIEEAISDLATFFGVSKLSAKLRFIDLGYEEARGAYDYQNSTYVPSYAFAKGSIKNNQSFTLSALDLASVYAVDLVQQGTLHQLIEAGAVKHVEYSLCLNDPKYIEEDEDGFLSLTDYARKHRDECCFKFELEFKKTATFGKMSQTYLFKKQVEELIPHIRYDATENGEILDKAKTLELQSQHSKALSTLLEELPGSFSKSLVRVMQVRGVTVEQLAEDSKVSTRTIQRYRNEQCTHDKDTVLNICVGLKLPVLLAENLLSKAGCPLGYSERDIVIRIILASGNYSDNFDFHVQCENILRAAP